MEVGKISVEPQISSEGTVMSRVSASSIASKDMTKNAENSETIKILKSNETVNLEIETGENLANMKQCNKNVFSLRSENTLGVNTDTPLPKAEKSDRCLARGDEKIYNYTRDTNFADLPSSNILRKNSVKASGKKCEDVVSIENKSKIPEDSNALYVLNREETLHGDDINNRLSPSTQSQTSSPKQHNFTKSTVTSARGVAAPIVVIASGINATIPDTILSPPKSETQTDDANTATSSSPASDSQLSASTADTTGAGSEALTAAALPHAPAFKKAVPLTTTTTSSVTDTRYKITPKIASKRSASISVDTIEGMRSGDVRVGGKRVVQPIDVVANGTIPKSSGKPHMLAMNKKLKEKVGRTQKQRKQKCTVPIYESELSDHKTGIKLCIKKSDSSGNLVGSTTASAPPTTGRSSASVSAPSETGNAAKQTRKRSRKSKNKARIVSDGSEYEFTLGKRGKKGKSTNVDRQKRVSFTGVEEQEDKCHEFIEQGDWGARIPQEILYKIFEILIDREGCLPTLCRLGRVCSLWRNISLTPTLWKSLDLSTWMKEKFRTELKLKWFVDNRCSECTELNVANWKMSDINCFLNKLAAGCPNLTSLTLSGWKGFTVDHLAYLTANMQKLERLDLSSVNVEMNASKTAVGPQSLCNALQTMNGRLTHLYLAHNRLAGIPQIVTTLATHCTSLVNLDLSNVTTQATSHGILQIEKLQHGCPKLKVLRVTNSHITWSNASLQETMDSPGFPDLEELSVAALTDESRVIGDDHLQRILKTSSKLKLLDVRGCARLTHESLIRLPAWDIKHLFLSGCSVTRDVGSGLELIASKWAHSLIELDLAWANVQKPLDNALRALAEKGSESPLAHLNLCGSSVSDEAVKEILSNCPHMSSINLSSCRGLPRGVKRLMQGHRELRELREVLKVQMKVKLPAQIRQEQEEEERRNREQKSSATKPDCDCVHGAGGGGSGGGNSQSN